MSDGGLKDNCEIKGAESFNPDCSVLKSHVSSSMANKFSLSEGADGRIFVAIGVGQVQRNVPRMSVQ